MKKMMFNDRFGQTEAVIDEIKEQTRRLMKNQSGNLAGQIKYTKKGSDLTYVRADFDNGITEDCPYAIGEIVAVAQSYSSFIKPSDWDAVDKLAHSKGWNNKMFVYADLMPHQIRILDVRAERLQDITDEDCGREGVVHAWSVDRFYFERKARAEVFYFYTLQEAFASLIDKISGRGTWATNPYVWRIEFELIK